MRIGDIVYFSQKYKYSDINWEDKKKVISAFKDRIESFFLTPAENLNKNKNAFASGLLCITVIDFLSKIQTDEKKVGKRIQNWLYVNIPDFNRKDSNNISYSKRFYEEFRNGIIHEGYIKNGGQFSYEVDNVVEIIGPIMIVNPRIFLEIIKKSFIKYLDLIQNQEEEYQFLKCSLLRIFREDIILSKS